MRIEVTRWWRYTHMGRLAKYWAAEEIATQYYINENEEENLKYPEFEPILPRHFIKRCWKTIWMAQFLKKEMMR